jgi:sporadic carbohydrate cluster protein (TIGR04323 family)
MNSRAGHRGYIASRPVRGILWPQHVQNLVVRDYCQRHGLHYLLSATEYAMPACYMNLEAVLDEAPRLAGVALFSIYMLPERRERRRAVVDRLFEAGADLHGALEGVAVRDRDDAARLEDLFQVEDLAAAAPVDELGAWLAGGDGRRLRSVA